MEPSRPPAPATRKAEATRAALLEAARVIIARDGYANARIVDIAQEAGKSAGVFYSYFEDKNTLFTALAEEFHDDLTRLTPAPGEYEEHTGPAVEQAVRVFWTAYQKFQPELAGLIEVSASDPALLAVWRKIRQRGIRRFAFRIRKQQEHGLCQGLDPELAASALHNMLEFTCFNWHSRKLDFPDQRVDDDKAIQTLYGLIARVLELHTPVAPAPAPGRRAARLTRG